MAQVSTTIPDHLDNFLNKLSHELGISKSSLLAMLIEIGLPMYAKTIVDRYKRLDVLDNLAKARVKEENKPQKSDPRSIVIEYAAGEPKD